MQYFKIKYVILESIIFRIFRKNLKPYVKINNIKQLKSNLSQQWTQGLRIQNCQFIQKKLRYKFINQKIKYHKIYQLSFQIQIKYNQKITLAYSIPYTYTNLLSSLTLIRNKYIKQQTKQNNDKFYSENCIKICKLCQTLTGLQVPVVIIGNTNQYTQEKQQKKVIIITSRIHPGQSNSSIIASSLINQLCQKTRSSSVKIFQKLIFVIVPMLNPDGVVLGNGRTGALGRDLNREFRSYNKYSYPQIVQLKQLIDKIQEYYQIQMYLDFHGHSKKKNMFIYGPNYNITEINYYKCRVFPKILSKRINFFRYFGCKYTIAQQKKSTARAVMLQQFEIPFFYTIETSIGFYYDYCKRHDKPFNKYTLIQIGRQVQQALRQYYESIQQYQKYIKSLKVKKQANNNKNTVVNNTNSKISNNKIQQNQQSVLVIKYLQEIRNQKINQDNQLTNINDKTLESDSCNSQSQLPMEKLKQFNNIIYNSNNNTVLTKSNINLSLSVNFNQLYTSQKTKRKRKRTNKNQTYQNQIFSNIILKNSTRAQSPGFVKSFKAKIRIINKNNKSSVNKQQLELYLHNINQKQVQRQLTINEQIKQKPQNQDLTINNFFNKVNYHFDNQYQSIKSINLSKMIQNPKSLRYAYYSPKQKNILPKHQLLKLNKTFLYSKDSLYKQKQQKIKQKIQYKRQQKMKQKRQQKRQQKIHYKKQQKMQQKRQIQMLSVFQNKSIQYQKDKQRQRYNITPRNYPSSFYRIKYHTSQKKIRQRSINTKININKLSPIKSQQKQQNLQQQYKQQNIKQKQKQQNIRQEQKQQNHQKYKTILSQSNNFKAQLKQKLFLNIAKIQ